MLETFNLVRNGLSGSPYFPTLIFIRYLTFLKDLGQPSRGKPT